MPSYRLTSPRQQRTLEADSCRVEGFHTVLRGTAYVMGRPQEVVVRRVPANVLVEPVGGLEVEDGPSWAEP